MRIETLSRVSIGSIWVLSIRSIEVGFFRIDMKNQPFNLASKALRSIAGTVTSIHKKETFHFSRIQICLKSILSQYFHCFLFGSGLFNRTNIRRARKRAPQLLHPPLITIAITVQRTRLKTDWLRAEKVPNKVVQTHRCRQKQRRHRKQCSTRSKATRKWIHYPSRNFQLRKQNFKFGSLM